MDSVNNSSTIHHLSSLVCLILMEELNQPINNSPVHWDRSRLEWNTHVNLKIFENRFHIMYRMDYDSFIVLYNLLKPYIKRDLSRSRASEPISNLLVVALGLRYLTGEKIRSLESDFQISNSTCYEVREIFIEAVLACPQLSINFPSSGQELSSIANGFAQKASEPIFKGCVGAIDGFFAPTKQPTKAESFGNQKSYYSGHYRLYGLNVQAVVDANLKFLYFGVVGPGSMNDCRSFMKSGLAAIVEKLPDGYYLVGDAAYPLSEHLSI